MQRQKLIRYVEMSPSLVTVIVAAGLLLLAFAYIGPSGNASVGRPTMFRTRMSRPAASGQSIQRSKSPSGVSGVSGALFRGTKGRAYTGAKLLGSSLPNLPHAHNNSSSGPRSSKWAVCTTIFKPSAAILATVALDGWAVVIVGDEGGAPFHTSAPNAVFLDVVAQQQMSSAYRGLLDLLPWKHFGRKNLGYLYAIAHGAEVIFDFDDDNVLKPGTQPTVPTTDIFHVQLADQDCPAFNPYPVMGGPSARDPKVPPSWPRGLPLDLIRKPCNHTLASGSTQQVAVVQSLADHDPDVDGIFRLTRGVPFNFDAASKRTLVIPQGTLTPWNAQATLLLYPAFWSLLLPVTVHGRVSDIWRSYISQRLLWDIGYRIAFSPPMVDQFRSPHNYLADMQAEEDLYYKAGQLVSFLRTWQGTASTLAGRYEELIIQLYERQYVELQDVQLTQQWLLTLMVAGYKFPPLVSSAVAASAPASAPAPVATPSSPP